jgi:hypothetical protein
MKKKPAGGTGLRENIVMVRWVLIIASAYLMLFSDGAPGAKGIGPVVIVLFLASNLVVSRLPEERFTTHGLKIGIAAFDTLVITTAAYIAGQVSVELLLLFLAVVVLAAAGLELGVIARVTLALSVTDILLMWLTGNELVWHSSMLLRIPFLLSAGLVYGALVEAGFAQPGTGRRMPLVAVDAVTRALVSQRDAIGRCQTALADGASRAAALNALNEIAGHNQEMQATMGRI